MSSRAMKSHLSIQCIYSLGPLLLRDPVLNDFLVIFEQIGVKDVQVGAAMSDYELINHLEIQVTL